MKRGLLFAGTIVAIAMTVSGAYAFNGGSSIGGGTPDAQNGAQGRNYPTANRGQAFVPADGYGYARQPRYYAPAHGYGYLRQTPDPYGRF